MKKILFIGLISALIVALGLGGLAYWQSNKQTKIVEKVQPSVTLISPNGGEILKKGSAYSIKWETRGITAENKISINIRRVAPPALPLEGQEFDPIIFVGLENTGSKDWNISETYPEGNYIIGITSYASLPVTDAVSDESDATFQIIDLPAAQAVYNCEEGKTMQAFFYKGKESAVEPGQPPIPSGNIKLVLSDGRNFDLAKTLSADGGRYANGDESFVFWDKGDNALVLENGAEKDYKGCQVQPAEEIMQNTAPVEFKEYAAAKDSSETVSAVNQFAFELYDQYKDAGKNIFFSPYSISSALQMTYEGAKGKTAEEIRSVFHFSQDSAARIGSFAKLYGEINPKNTTYQLLTANALWAQKSYPFNTDYLKIVQTYYGGEATNLDFAADAEGSRKIINKWVSDKTAAKIPQLFAPGSLNASTRLVLTNAIYFKGKWAAMFYKELTQEKDFTIAAGTKTKCQMMNQQRNFSYAETADYQAIELPYENNDLSMVVILPKTGKTGSVEKILSSSNFLNIKKSLASELVNVSLPKFKFDTEYNMNDTLAKMGMPAAFDPNSVDFSGMYDSSTGENFYIGLVIHKAYVDVYEEGTEAAAATGVAMVATAIPDEEPPQPKIFNADHPFIFAIVHNQTNSILFMGKVNDPTE
jgi:serpin B